MDEFANQLLSLIEIPIVLIQGDRISFANSAAKTLLGGHIEGQDIRIALRDPEALKLVKSPEGGRAQITGLSVRGSVWEMVCSPLANNNRLISLRDKSVQVSVARAHADFVANASHELRTPLTAILGYVETLSDPKAGEDLVTRQRFLDIIKREATRMQALVSDLMSLSRIEAVRHEVPSDEVEMVSLCREVIGERLRESEVEFSSNVDKVIATGDHAQLAQVVRNLVDNAEKYGRSDVGTKVRLESSDRGWLTLTVTDHGEGIAPEHLPRLTERFYRADTGRSRAAGGTGLGLAIVKHIVERHRGRFDISSRQGEGTTATIMLPQS
ncbi:two-component sensor histidine kinase [Sphingorhabdus pulchriflava]|uniref:histidine kinase n=1 Tax=Sphingorhabdus pulchriflava TaxID=2292257 RepID=A0A371BJA9_9SPHN|nr:ATP-binding protein [Sphingorhabdus pulchriflava]RDV07668.1 two-component sensor histidine kinase [Sphingorhabdus pulchriflava]